MLALIAFDKESPTQTEKLLHPLNEEKADIFFTNQLPLEDDDKGKSVKSSRETLCPLLQLAVVLITRLVKHLPR